MKHPDPLFSVIVPTYNRPEQVRTCLGSLARLDYPRDRFEVLLVDDGGTQPLDAIVDTFRDAIDIQLIQKGNGGPASARNAGADAARGRYLAFLDDDCQPSPEWLQVLADRFARCPDCLIGGQTLNILHDDAYAVTSQVILDMVYAFFNPDPERSRFFTSNNMALSANLFRELRGFDMRFRCPGAEDRDLCDRLLHGNGTLLFVPEARMFHRHPMSLWNYCKHIFGYGRGAYRYHRYRAERGSGTLWQETRMHLELPRLAREPLKQLPASQVPSVLALLVIWQATNAAGYLYEKLTFR